MPRGGKRPGAGAPKGNFNALKHGRRSRQFAELGVTLAANPATREAMLRFARKLDAKQEDALKAAFDLHTRIMDHARKIAIGEYSPGPFEHLLKTKADSPSPLARKTGEGLARRAGGEGRHGLNVQSHDAERRSIKENSPSATSRQHGRPREGKNHRPHNQTPNTVPPDNQTPNTKPAPKPID